jgi:gluconolactonase
MITHTKVVKVDQIRAATDIEYAASFTKEPSFVLYNDKFLDLLGQSPKLNMIEERNYQFAHEAGVYIRRTDSVYFTANFQTCDPVDLYAINCKTLKVEKLTYPDVVNANGACHFNDGVLYCSQGDRTIPSALVWVDPGSGKSETLVNNFRGRQFSSINDVVIHHETGDIWFTDPCYGYEQGFRPTPVLPSQVYRFNPSTKEIWCVADGFLMCNGLCFNHDYTKMYVTDTGAVMAHDGVGDGHNFSFNPRKPASIYVYDVIDKKFLANRRMFAYCDSWVPDGIKCDEYGNVYSGCGDGIHVWDPEGTLIGKISVTQIAANFCFAKGGMWIFAEKNLYFCEMKAKGALVDIECY